MGYIQRREDRPKPWLARYRGPDGKYHGKSFRRKVDAERWLREEEGKSDRDDWVDPAAGKVRFAGWSETWLRGLHSVKPKTLAGSVQQSSFSIPAGSMAANCSSE